MWKELQLVWQVKDRQSMHVTEWNFVLELPTVIGIHKALDGFLQTSSHGRWTRDSSQPSEKLVRYFRGSWKETEKGLLPVRSKVRRRKEAPLQLELEILSSNEGSRLAMTFRFCWHKAVSEKYEKAFEEYVTSESHALAEYLRDYYALEECPTLVAARPI
jgi:hypothetical protein